MHSPLLKWKRVKSSPHPSERGISNVISATTINGSRCKEGSADTDESMGAQTCLFACFLSLEADNSNQSCYKQQAQNHLHFNWHFPQHLTSLFTSSHQPIESIHISLGTGDDNIGISTPAGIGYAITLYTYQDLANGVNALGY